MQFDSNGVQINYEVFGEGRPVVLVHGFASSLDGNWVRTGWVETLKPLRQVIALDCRGHGESEKRHDPDAYASEEMADDVVRLMDHVGVESADLFGYSMGAGISLRIVLRHPERFTSVVLGGIGGNMTRRRGGRPEVGKAMLAKDPKTVSDPVARGFRQFAEANGADLRALAAFQQAPRTPIEPSMLGEITLPCLIVVGEDDALVGSADDLASAIPGSRLLTIPGRDHLTVVPDQRFKDAVTGFLSALPSE